MLTSLVLALLSTFPAEAAANARLNDICFVNAQHGWAVGDRGAIWHTSDGDSLAAATLGSHLSLAGGLFLE